MLSKFRTRLTFANVVSVVALFVALGGSSYAAITITGKNVKNSSLTGTDLKNNSVTGADVKGIKSADVTDRSLLAQDFKAGQLPAGPSGPQGTRGDKGNKGDKGDDGAPGTARAYAWGGGFDCNGVVSPDSCPLHKNKGVAYMIPLGSGIYCIGVNGIDASAADSLAIVSVVENASTASPFAEWRAVNAACAPQEFEVATFYDPVTTVRNSTNTGTTDVSGTMVTGGSNVGFSITIP